MSTFRIALANIQFPATPEASIALAEQAIAQASIERAGLICFPECFIPGYRGLGKVVPPPDPIFLERAWSAVGAAAARANLAVVLGTERVVDKALFATALVVNRDGTVAGFQDKVQIDPSEEGTYSPGSGRRLFQAGPLTFGVVICHEGWRYPETVRWAARRAHRVPPAFPHRRARQLPALEFRGSWEHIPRESSLVPRRREHLLFRDGELCKRGVADHFGGGTARRHAAQLPALR